MVAPAACGRVRNGTPRFRHHGLEVVGLEREPGPMSAHDVLQPRAAQIGPGRGEAVVAVDPTTIRSVARVTTEISTTRGEIGGEEDWGQTPY